MGFQNLLEHDAKKVHEGNQFLSVSCQVLNLGYRAGNPMGAGESFDQSHLVDCRA